MQIITENQYEQTQKEFNHLIDIGIPPANMLENKISFTVRDGIEHVGFLMLGDLLVFKHETSVLEAHPFPEWVIQLHQIAKKSGKVFVILPKFSIKQMKRLNRNSVDLRIEKTKEMLEKLNVEDFIAIEYIEGISIKINANVPHEFISIVGEGEVVPYCQVFEPDFSHISETLKINSTSFFDLKDNLKL
ncbi:hypothetical protein DSAG12_03775 [Promethearchaeum syntrophicum]|uniref:Uncharacterized protein n=1 Tax=Promethearchaeum syntrophicum TaxID=2594042 RepID=A0A5B9DGZ9_9ARCH|nr:hypothetical protein [Candidatus Prometheoarchaeum syntrophicum]QEE17937.1 hypothetical protein DSAG12_03775 [Candidatus Prometheoarchaeum syntrophicum]